MYTPVDTNTLNPNTLNALAWHMVEIERERGVCHARDLLAQGFSQADLDFYGDKAKRQAAEIKARTVRVVDSYATDEDARLILNMRISDLIAASDDPNPVNRRDFARRARTTARTLESGPVCGSRTRPYAARMLVEFAIHAERA
jgi:hypothetical protein